MRPACEPRRRSSIEAHGCWQCAMLRNTQVCTKVLPAATGALPETPTGSWALLECTVSCPLPPHAMPNHLPAVHRATSPQLAFPPWPCIAGGTPLGSPHWRQVPGGGGQRAAARLVAWSQGFPETQRNATQAVKLIVKTAATTRDNRMEVVAEPTDTDQPTKRTSSSQISIRSVCIQSLRPRVIAYGHRPGAASHAVVPSAQQTCIICACIARIDVDYQAKTFVCIIEGVVATFWRARR